MDTATGVSTVLVKPVSADCNLSCTYCFYLSSSRLYPHTRIHRMSDEVLKKLIIQMLSISPERAHFCWQGGEPTLAGLEFYKRAVKYQSLFRAIHQIVENSIQSNGLLIDDEWGDFLSKHSFLVGVSLDGPLEIHDSYRRDPRGKGSYNLVIKCTENLARHHVEFNILAVINNYNVKEPKMLYRFFVDRGFKYLQFIPCVELDSSGEIAWFSITPEEYGRFLCEVFDKWFDSGVSKIYVRDFEEILMLYVLGDTSSCVFADECGRYIVVEHNGDVYPCDFFIEPEWLLGNILEDDLENILKSRKLREFAFTKEKLRGKCIGCKWLNYCRGGCPKHWKTTNFSYNYFCQSYKVFFEYAHEKFLELKERLTSFPHRSL
jgi:uncharacterized protein